MNEANDLNTQSEAAFREKSHFWYYVVTWLMISVLPAARQKATAPFHALIFSPHSSEKKHKAPMTSNTLVAPTIAEFHSFFSHSRLYFVVFRFSYFESKIGVTWWRTSWVVSIQRIYLLFFVVETLDQWWWEQFPRWKFIELSSAIAAANDFRKRFTSWESKF